MTPTPEDVTYALTPLERDYVRLSMEEASRLYRMADGVKEQALRMLAMGRSLEPTTARLDPMQGKITGHHVTPPQGSAPPLNGALQEATPPAPAPPHGEG